MGKPPEPRANAPTTKTPENLPLEQAIEKTLKGVVQDRQIPGLSQRIAQVLVSQRFQGPLPHPKHLREYEDISPGLADRIVTMAEKTLDHNIEMESKSLFAEIKDRERGMWLGAGIMALLVLGAIVVALAEATWEVPVALVGAGAIGGVGLFIKGRDGGNHTPP